MDNIKKKEYDDDDETYFEILKINKCKSNQIEVLENEIEHIKKELKEINEGYMILVQKLMFKSII